MKRSPLNRSTDQLIAEANGALLIPKRVAVVLLLLVFSAGLAAGVFLSLYKLNFNVY